MERIHMNYYKDIIYRLRAGESERQIARSWVVILAWLLTSARALRRRVNS